MRVHKFLFIAVMIGLLVSTHADAASYRLPADPIGPTSIEACKRLAAQYRKIILSINREAKRAGDQAWSLVRSHGVGAGDGYYAKAKQLHNKSSELSFKFAGPAYNRCQRQVNAYNRRLSAQRMAASKKSFVPNRSFISNNQPAPQKNLASPRKFIVKKGPDSLGNVNNAVRNAPQQSGYSFLKESAIFGMEKSKIRGARATGTVENIIETVNYFRNRSNKRTAASELNKLDYLGSMGGEILRNPLQQAVFKAAMGQIIEINRGALNDFNAAFQKREGGVPAASFYLSQISAKSYSENALLGAAIQDAGIQGAESQDDALTTALKASIQVLENIQKDRIEATQVAIAKDRQIKAQQASDLRRRQKEERLAEIQRQRKYQQKQARLRQEQDMRRARERQARLDEERDAEQEAEEEYSKPFVFGDPNALQNAMELLERSKQERARQQRPQQRLQPTFNREEWCADNPQMGCYPTNK